MNRKGKDATQLNQLTGYLKALKLLDSRNSFPNSGFSIAAVRGLSYADIWKLHIQKQWYDIRLDDNALFYFYKDGSNVSYSFLGCPFECESFSEYKSKAENADIEDYLIEESYEQYLGTSVIKESPYYFRYDLETTSYRPGEHPAAHIHCGLMDSVRIGVGKELDFMSFAAFILRQVYVDAWSVVLTSPDDYHELYCHKANLPDVSPQYFQQKDKDQDFYLF